MIIIDYNGIAIANIMVQKLAIDENVIRHMILNSIRMYRKRFGQEYGVVLIDAEHTYDALRKDTLSCWKHLKDNGFAIFHDYGLFPGVTEFLDTLSNMYDGFYAQNEHLVVIKKI